MDASQTSTQARASAGRSARALALRAGFTATTVTRIENGRTDPGVGTLTALLRAAGLELQLVTVPVAPEGDLADLVDAWAPGAHEDRPDSTRLRAFLDALPVGPLAVGRTLSRPPAASGSVVHDTLLAGLAEKCADEAGIQRPAWTSAVAPLEQEWITPGTPRMQATARRRTPPQLSVRGLVVDRESLWRSPQSSKR